MVRKKVPACDHERGCDFLVELGTEELPPKACSRWRSFRDGVVSRLDAAGLHTAGSMLSPRRAGWRCWFSELARCAAGAEDRAPRPAGLRRLRQAGKPTRAATAFAEPAASTSMRSRASRREGRVPVFRGMKPGRGRELLPGIVQAALDALPIPKRMRWGAGERTVRAARALAGDAAWRQVVAGESSASAAGRMTRGHRFHGRARCAQPGGYEEVLQERAMCCVDFAARRARDPRRRRWRPRPKAARP